jgi:hypothetical protein
MRLTRYRPEALLALASAGAVRYAGRRTFLELVASPAYCEIVPYKLSSPEIVLTAVSGELVIPDPALDSPGTSARRTCCWWAGSVRRGELTTLTRRPGEQRGSCSLRPGC